MKTKKCNKCGKIKPLTEFHKNKTSKDYHTSLCKNCRNKANKEYTKTHKPVLSPLQKLKRKLYQKEWRKQNKDTLQQKSKQYYLDNKEHIKETSQSYRKKKMATDELYKFKVNIRKHMLICFKRKGINKGRITKEILGCDLAFFKEYIEAQFTEGMTWNNYGVHGWHYDHIIPLANAKTEEEVVKLCHYTNYQPLWAQDNYKKAHNNPKNHQKRLL
jgi:hypothetical protein